MKPLLVLVLMLSAEAWADGKKIKLGYIGSLSGFAAAYGTAVLEGARLAVEQLEDSGELVELVVEDDQSLPKNTATAYLKLRGTDHIDALLGGSWWVNSIAKTVERDGLPFISCETLYNKEFVKAENYFSLLGDLRDWVRVHVPMVEAEGLKRGAMVKFVSGFADTLREEFEAVFRKNGRTFVQAIEYSDFDMQEAPAIALQLKRLNPDALYIDAQPAGFAAIMKKLIDQDLKPAVFTNSIAKDAVEEKLFDPALFKGRIYYSARETYSPEFLRRFSGKYQKNPILNSDLGYYGALLLHAALKAGDDPVAALKRGAFAFDGIRFNFDRNNVFTGFKQEVFTFEGGKQVTYPGNTVLSSP